MAGRIGDDELALRRRKEPIGHIDCDALFALRLQPVHQKREIKLSAIRPMAQRIVLQRCQLVLEHKLCVIEKPADERRLAVINRTAGQKPQERLVLLRGDIGPYIRRWR